MESFTSTRETISHIKIRALKIGENINENWKKMFRDNNMDLKGYDKSEDKMNEDKIGKNKTINYEDMTVDVRDYGRKHAEKIIKDLRQRRNEIAIELCALGDLLEELDKIDEKVNKGE